MCVCVSMNAPWVDVCTCFPVSSRACGAAPEKSWEEKRNTDLCFHPVPLASEPMLGQVVRVAVGV